QRDRVTPCAEVAWCDVAGQFAGCCGAGLVPSGDGICTCPKGGSAQRPDCAAPLHPYDEYVSRYLSTATRRAVARCGPLSDKVGFAVHVDPDGRLFNPQIHGGDVADDPLQRCMLDALGALTV